MTDYNTCLQSVAAISSAVAAIAAVYVARSTFIFQKQSLLNKMTIEQMQKLVQQLQYLKSLTGQGVLGAADGEVTKLSQRISEMKECVVALKSMISDSAQTDLKKVSDFVHGLLEENIFASDDNTPNDALSRQLDVVIEISQNIYRKELK